MGYSISKFFLILLSLDPPLPPDYFFPSSYFHLHYQCSLFHLFSILLVSSPLPMVSISSLNPHIRLLGFCGFVKAKSNKTDWIQNIIDYQNRIWGTKPIDYLRIWEQNPDDEDQIQTTKNIPRSKMKKTMDSVWKLNREDGHKIESLDFRLCKHVERKWLEIDYHRGGKTLNLRRINWFIPPNL